jgi:hypothetical protein
MNNFQLFYLLDLKLMVSQHDDSIPDAILTAYGKSQCHDLNTSFPHHDSVALIVSSPLRRALQTSVHAFAPALQRDEVKVLLQPMAQEMNAYACDIGTDREELEKQVKSGELWDKGLNVSSEKIDFNLVEDRWNSKVCLSWSEYADADGLVGRQVGTGSSNSAETCCEVALVVIQP